MMCRYGRIRQRCVCALLIASAAVLQSPALADDPNIVERFDFEMNGDYILVPVRMDGKESLFVVDTGSTWTIFDKSLLSFEPKGQMTVDGSEWTYYNVPLATIGNRNLGEDLIAGQHMARIWTLPLENVSEASSMRHLFLGVTLRSFGRLLALKSTASSAWIFCGIGSCKSISTEGNSRS